MQETGVRSLGWEDPLEEGMATHSSIFAWRIPMDRGAWQATVHGVTESDTTERVRIHTHTSFTNTFLSTFACLLNVQGLISGPVSEPQGFTARPPHLHYEELSV